MALITPFLKNNLIIIIFLELALFIFSNISVSHLAYAQSPPPPVGEGGYQGTYCVPNAGQHICSGDRTQVLVVNCDGSSSYVQTCWLSQDQRCDTGSGSCQSVQETNITILDNSQPVNLPNNTPSLGDTVNVQIVGTGTCQANATLIPGPGLHNIDDFENPDCKLISSVCLTPNPPNQSYRCTYNYQCIAYQLSYINPDNNLMQPYTATFTSSSGSSCTSTAPYSVGKALSCAQGVPVPTIDPQGISNDNLVAPSLNDDKIVSQIFNISLLPQDIYNQATALITDPLPNTAVQLGFFDVLKNLLCDPRIKALFGFLIKYCPVPVNFGIQQTDFYTTLSKNVTLTDRPTELRTNPSTISCYIKDLTTNPQTPANGSEKLSDTDIAAATTNGYYVNNTPDIVDYTQTDQSLFNISINKEVVSGDNRAPDINCAAQKFVNLFFPEGFTPPHLLVFGCANGSTSPPPPPPIFGGPNACSKWPITNPIGNFGDPNCDFTKDGLYTLLRQNDPVNANYWFNVVVACESGYNPDAYADHFQIHTPDLAGAWGLFQMGRGKNGQYDHGDVIWNNQITNAINYNNNLAQIGLAWRYWACAKSRW